jgi:ATP-dependent Lon protease
LKFRAKALSRTAEIDEMIRLLDRVTGLSAVDQAEIYAILDQKLSLTEKSGITIAKAISERMPHGTACPKSAHIIALDVLSDKKQRASFTEVYNELIPQGFPSVKNADYITSLINALFKARLNSQEMKFVIQLFCRDPDYINALVAEILSITTAKKSEDWNMLILIAAEKQDRNLAEALINECVKLKQGEKVIDRLGDMLEKRENRDYFLRAIAPQLKEIIRFQKPQSGLFGGWFSGDDGSKKKKW